jgi:uncharacterized OB-fold protein
MTTTLQLQQGLFEHGPEGAPRLLASRCAACDRVFFPRRAYCGQCSASGLEAITLAARGQVHSFSVIDRKQKIAVVNPPYVQAEVRMPEGVHVFTVLDQCGTADVRIGMEVEVYVDEVPAPSGEGKVLAYKFRPAQGVAA